VGGEAGRDREAEHAARVHRVLPHREALEDRQQGEDRRFARGLPPGARGAEVHDLERDERGGGERLPGEAPLQRIGIRLVEQQGGDGRGVNHRDGHRAPRG
jgi:hypothetical protein